MRDVTDRMFVIAFGASMGVHLILSLGQMVPLKWLTAPRSRSSTLEVIYELEVATLERQRLQEQLARAARERGAAPSVPSASNRSERPQIVIPTRPSLVMDRTLSDLTPTRSSSVVDLTNPVDAARGDPVLLSYFSAIREQIQQTANRHVWLTGHEAEGLVYVSFLLASSGAAKTIDVVPERSVDSHTLREVALRIVKSAAPFPPFPPSMIEPSKTIVVPLEFLLGS